VVLVLCAAAAQAQYNLRGVDGTAVDIKIPALRSEPKVAWEVRPGFRDFGAIAVSNGVVVTVHINDAGGAFGFDANTGKRLWTIPGTVRGAPAVDAKAAYVMNGGDHGNYRLTAADLKTGRKLWSIEGDDLGTYDDPPLVTNGKVFLLNRTAKATAHDAATGKLLWEQPYDQGHGNCPTPIAYANGMIYFGGGHFLWALDAASGRVVWKYEANPFNYQGSAECVSAPAVAAGIAVVTARHGIYALDARTGQMLWKNLVEYNGKIDDLAEPVILDGAVYSYSVHALFAWDLWKGTRVLDMPGKFDVLVRMNAAGGLLYFMGNLSPAEGNRKPLHAYDPKMRQVLWSHFVNRDVRGFTEWRTLHFLPVDGAIYYETAMLLVKIQ
jgi:outer membrane protein assembly factor BamB